MKIKSSGSAILIILLVTASLLWYLTIAYNTTILYTDIILHKRQYEQQKWYAEGLIQWAIGVAKVSFDQLKTQIQNNPLHIGLRIGFEMPHEQTGVVTFSKATEQEISIIGKATRGNAQCTIACRLERRILDTLKTEFIVQDWSIIRE